MKKIVVVCGPTAAGKSQLGMHLAQHLGVPVLSADSRQVYREFDIGTAKPTREEQRRVEHCLIDVAWPTEHFNVARYRELADAEIDRLTRQGKPALLVGGSGLYLRAVSGGLEPPAVPPDPALRARLAVERLDALYQRLQQLDPESAGRIHPNDQVRIERALEVCLTTGQPLSAQRRLRARDFSLLALGVGSGREALVRRIEQRTHRMIEAGWLEEVEYLRAKYGPDLPLLSTLGYAELGAYLEERWDLAEALQQIVVHTRQFAKRQMTWFRAEPDVHWLDESAGRQTLEQQSIEQVERFLAG
ncbi:tRNA (adenosine(37)-N6)-dimethylallyltransferase MiaA [Gloeobacter violaceus]|uniref:tRNA dimethylallyltransferase n=1 Tax=Gloeobacter violaceus (strain ATCC 29082 / PCC 7421) TaxID=251221 RepID=MIAA_GLOVI|nr:tRNA (adenosine(37)-N6)-dimethylallyltransferase MiaA [Gloeobacter violaceus]Q7MBC1.1 RecName: Full=tRNA dimethylallyltransferase; AltName: Full=Dimethylallyl diphosphate:tRNA dimethylallyltransferase; Short=DMAPP:tRNA dimethylallyltransferase; Short=DMATase; AltName: Full=Isopentenyl-diphosphate:tRNA isopentenyltransferase; Short=IPP transferase; Short=IPPT; Short=IPTase [Gloeobacter violaceus PCC 7421]BAC91189.1 tRNA delta-2-isopentenylpyrophosphate [Gloeobacter violaceus PCC 7421]